MLIYCFYKLCACFSNVYIWLLVSCGYFWLRSVVLLCLLRVLGEFFFSIGFFSIVDFVFNSWFSVYVLV